MPKKSRRYGRILLSKRSKRDFWAFSPKMAREIRIFLKSKGYKNLPSTKYKLTVLWNSSIPKTIKNEFYAKQNQMLADNLHY